jgi:hypothetical protein
LFLAIYIYAVLNYKSKSAFVVRKAAVVTIACVIAFFAAFLLRPKLISIISIPTTRLIDSDNRIVLLPYNRSITTDQLFKKYDVSTDYPIFVEKYLMYHPQYKVINNSPITDFSGLGNFIIVNDSRNSFSEGMLLSKNFQDWYIRNNQSISGNTYLIDKFFYNDENNYTAVISYSCNVGEKPTPISIVMYNKNSLKERVPFRQFSLYDFPGCEKGETKKFVVPVSFDSVPEGDVLLYINVGEPALANSANLIVDMDLRVDPAGVKRFNYNEKQKAFFSFEDKNSEEVTSYFFDTLVNKFSITRSGSKYDLAMGVNKLNNMKAIYGHIKIWSLVDNIILANTYDDEL